MLILLAGSTRTKHFACSDVLTRWRWAERPVMAHCQSGKTLQDISDLAEGPTNAPQRKGSQSGYGANAAPKGANAWDNNIDLVDLKLVLHLVTSDHSASFTSLEKQLAYSIKKTSPRSLFFVGTPSLSLSSGRGASFTQSL